LDGHAPADVSILRTRLPASLLRVIRQHAALDAKTLDDFVREAIEERLRSS
jgi:hypothetical protein